MNKSGEICLRQGANHSEVRPRTAEQVSRASARGCAPDPVREALVREGALKAAIDIFETGRNASAPANGPAANGSQPHPAAGCLAPRTRSYARLRGRIPKGAPAPRSGAHLARICNAV